MKRKRAPGLTRQGKPTDTPLAIGDVLRGLDGYPVTVEDVLPSGVWCRSSRFGRVFYGTDAP